MIINEPTESEKIEFKCQKFSPAAAGTNME